jgi:hypothetical protein
MVSITQEWIMTCPPEEAVHSVLKTAEDLGFTPSADEGKWIIEVPFSWGKNQFAATLTARVSEADIGALMVWHCSGKEPMLALAKLQKHLVPGTIYDHGIAKAASKIAGSVLAFAEMAHLPSVLAERENVQVMGLGKLRGKTGILAVTDSRLIFLEKGLVRKNLVEFNIGVIETTEYRRGMGGSKFTIRYGGTTAEIKDLPADQAQAISDKLRELKAAPVTASSTSPKPDAGSDSVDTIRRMAQLRDEGILTEEEFREKKAQLLRRL